MNILVMNAHPDDLELMAGGSVARWNREGHQIHAITVSAGGWIDPAGTSHPRETAIADEQRAADKLGYAVENLNEPAMDMKHEDRLVRIVLDRIQRYQIDTLVCPYEGDIHHDHEVLSRIALSASRRVPRVLMGQINWYLRRPFTPNIFVDITDTWDLKIAALKCYHEEWRRAGEKWISWLDESSRIWGRMMGVQRAEGFVSQKYLL